MKEIIVSGFIIYLCMFWISRTGKEVERIMSITNVDGTRWVLITIFLVLSKALFSSLIFGFVFYVASSLIK